MKYTFIVQYTKQCLKLKKMKAERDLFIGI